MVWQMITIFYRSLGTGGKHISQPSHCLYISESIPNDSVFPAFHNLYFTFICSENLASPGKIFHLT